jgi:hypothetical protein
LQSDDHDRDLEEVQENEGGLPEDDDDSDESDSTIETECTCDHHDTNTFVQETSLWKFEWKHMTRYKHPCYKCVGCRGDFSDIKSQVWMCKKAQDRNHPCEIAYCVDCFFKSAWNTGRPSRNR